MRARPASPERERAPARCVVAAAALAVLAVAPGCGATAWRARIADTPDNVDLDAPFVKCHMPDGRVYVLQHWTLDAPARVIRGEGLLYDADRALVGTGHYDVGFDDVALVETNRPESVERPGFAILGVTTGVSLGVSAACAANPKACFGSCPTFWVSDGDHPTLQAEGFSSSIARQLEATDVDALWNAVAGEGTLDVRMTNEALETHVVRSVRVLAAVRPEGARVALADGHYFAVRAPEAPLACRTDAGASCADAVARFDGVEYLSLTDPDDLGAQETVELVFRARPGPVALLVHGRSSLLSTFLFYQTLAYAGREAGDWIRRFERAADAGEPTALDGISDVLGGVLVSVLGADGTWRDAAHRFGEVGPIAAQTEAIVLPDGGAVAGELRVRLTMTRGNVKLDGLALVSLGEELSAEPLELAAVEHEGAPDERARALLAPGGGALVTYPGDTYALHFVVPDARPRELFLESRGYYYEWMRSQWLTEESPLELARMLTDPRGALRRLAPRYKRIESSMERIFWQSRYGR